MKIAIDGPGSAGKSTVAKRLAKALGMTYIDTGAMYRAVAYAVIARGLDTDDENAVIGELDGIDVGIAHDPATGEQRVSLNGKDVTPFIRAHEMSIGASNVSRVPKVRLKMVDLQRKIAEGRDVVMDGRDIGTFVFPDAENKFFLTASDETRARRRYLELQEKGADISYERCLSDLRLRDRNDSARAFAPLSVADDAIIVETDNMTICEVVELLRACITGYGG